MADTTAGIVPALPADHEAKFEQLVRKRMPIAKDDMPVEDDTNVEESTQDQALDERAMAALKAVYRILLPFKGQIPEDAVDDVLAELDLDDTGDEGQYGDDDATDEDGEVDEPEQEDDQAMADKKLEELEKATDWSPSQADGTSDDDHSKGMTAAKAAYAKCVNKDAGDDDEDDDDDDVKKSAVKKAALPSPSDERATLIAKAESARSEAIAAESARREAVAKTAGLEERVAKMEDEASLKAYEEAIRRDCQVLGKDSLSQAKIVKSAYAANKSAGDAYVTLLKESAKMTHTSGVFKSIGTSNNAAFGAAGIPGEQGSPQQQMDAMLHGLVQKGEVADESAAWNAVMKTQRGQDLYNQIHGSKH